MRVIGHRGCAGLRPENTLAAFRHAVALGVDVVECDVHRTRDGCLAVIHDERVDRTTPGRGAVSELTMVELRRLDVPELDEVLQAVGGRAELAVELKAPGTATLALKAVEDQGLLGAATFISFDLGRLEAVRRLSATARTGALLGRPGAEAVGQARACGATVLDVHFAALTPALLEEARAAGLAVWTWTPNAAEDLRAQLALGPDGVTTDHPDRLLALLGRAVGEGGRPPS